MAVIGIKDTIRLQIELDAGLIEGKQYKVTRNYNNIRPAITNEKAHQLGLILAGLQEKSVLRFNLNEITTLTEE